MKNFSQFQAILFDLDGTLVDTVYGIAATLNQMLLAHDKPAQSVSRIRNTVSRGGKYLVDKLFDIDLESPAGETLMQRFFDCYPVNASQHDKPFVGCEALLNFLEQQHLPWGIVTNKLTRHSESLIERLNWQNRCACLVSADTTTQAKPAPTPLFYACEQLGVDPSKCLYIGDDLNDITAGKAANMATAVALHGYIDSATDPYCWQANHYFHDLCHFQDWLKFET